MGLNDFKDKNRNELSMIEVARAILEDNNKRMAFADIVNAVQNFLGESDEEIRERLPQFYTDMNTNGEFISMGENIWALRSWFPYESVDEEVNHPEDEDQEDTRTHHQKVNAFLADATGSDDIIDYDNDDPEDEDLDAVASDDADDFDAEADIDDEPDEEELPDGIEGQLSELDDDEDDDGEEE
ncbi:DNA-directed RNA polymerase subunit delta [Lactobacillus sp. ESL0684]|uniref:DNA-directed RNA polymerase subunit delta n=1 Tax=unclassified Lactobacillus TaxID=2620435 RepID=UPI0023F9B98F|nr:MULTISPECIES: DNA-directed RNA polymerase subunit delta [unclassified Lactobacillus]WEV40071.1 DNA-directed RNA polymerase subunit delta [Lactobacillus sp. ESL0681]WEV43389.1 DNA-directed RNA polymerase subunit delta [Lactobacillus sp. ESL0684]